MAFCPRRRNGRYDNPAMSAAHPRYRRSPFQQEMIHFVNMRNQSTLSFLNTIQTRRDLRYRCDRYPEWSIHIHGVVVYEIRIAHDLILPLISIRCNVHITSPTFVALPLREPYQNPQPSTNEATENYSELERFIIDNTAAASSESEAVSTLSNPSPIIISDSELLNISKLNINDRSQVHEGSEKLENSSSDDNKQSKFGKKCGNYSKSRSRSDGDGFGAVIAGKNIRKFDAKCFISVPRNSRPSTSSENDEFVEKFTLFANNEHQPFISVHSDSWQEYKLFPNRENDGSAKLLSSEAPHITNYERTTYNDQPFSNPAGKSWESYNDLSSNADNDSSTVRSNHPLTTSKTKKLRYYNETSSSEGDNVVECNDPPSNSLKEYKLFPSRENDDSATCNKLLNSEDANFTNYENAPVAYNDQPLTNSAPNSYKTNNDFSSSDENDGSATNNEAWHIKNDNEVSSSEIEDEAAGSDIAESFVSEDLAVYNVAYSSEGEESICCNKYGGCEKLNFSDAESELLSIPTISKKVNKVSLNTSSDSDDENSKLPIRYKHRDDVLSNNDNTKSSEEDNVTNQVESPGDSGSSVLSFVAERVSLPDVRTKVLGTLNDNLEVFIPPLQWIEKVNAAKEDSGNLEANRPKCFVCFKDFIPSDVITMSPCGHEFHRDCVVYYRSSCPVCGTKN